VFTGALSLHNVLDALQQVRFDPAMWSHVQTTATFESEAQAGTLPAVSWVIANEDEHAPRTTCAGQNQSVQYINDVMNGPDWSSTAIFEWWDEWGGFYDHVVPPVPGPGINSALSYGFRVPLLVISPFVKAGDGPDGGYVSHTFYSQESAPKFVEANWELPNLTPRDGPASAAGDLMDFFDFSGHVTDKLVLTTVQCPALTPAQRQQIADAEPGDY